MAKQPWDPSVQGLVQVPDVLQRMAENVQWTTDLGNAFLAQQSEVMAAVQRMRAKAQGTGNLKTSEQSVVQTETVPSGQQVIKIEQANPEVSLCPVLRLDGGLRGCSRCLSLLSIHLSGVCAGTALAWGAGIALGAAAWGAWGGHWGNCDWNGGNVNINNNYNYNKNVNRNNANRGQNGGNWQHNPSHRGNAPYGDRGTANKFGGRGPGGAGGAGRPGGVGGAGGVGGVGGVGGAGRPGGRRRCRRTPEGLAVPVVLAVQAEPEDLADLVVQVELVNLVVLGEPVSLVVQAEPGGLADLVVQVESESLVVQVEPDLVLAAEPARVRVAEADLVPVAVRIQSAAAVPQGVAVAVVLSAEAAVE